MSIFGYTNIRYNLSKYSHIDSPKKRRRSTEYDARTSTQSEPQESTHNTGIFSTIIYNFLKFHSNPDSMTQLLQAISEGNLGDKTASRKLVTQRILSKAEKGHHVDYLFCLFFGQVAEI